MLYSSMDAHLKDIGEVADSNTYQPFRTVDASVMKGIVSHINTIDETEHEGRLRTVVISHC